MKFVICYDISNPKDLYKVAKYLEKKGIRVQYSIFEIETSFTKLKAIISEIENLINPETDKVYAYPIENNKYKSVERFGKSLPLNIL